MKNRLLQVGFVGWSWISVVAIMLFGFLFLATMMAMPRGSEVSDEFKLIFMGLMLLAMGGFVSIGFMVIKSRENISLRVPVILGIGFGLITIGSLYEAARTVKSYEDPNRYYEVFFSNFWFPAIAFMLIAWGMNKLLSHFENGSHGTSY